MFSKQKQIFKLKFFQEELFLCLKAKAESFGEIFHELLTFGRYVSGYQLVGALPC